MTKPYGQELPRTEARKVRAAYLRYLRAQERASERLVLRFVALTEQGYTQAAIARAAKVHRQQVTRIMARGDDGGE